MATNPSDRPRAGDHGLANRARRLTTETKASYKTSELIIWAIVTLGILIAANQIEAEEGNADYFTSDKAWLYITILSGAYFIGRGLAKSGSRDPYTDDGDND